MSIARELDTLESAQLISAVDAGSGLEYVFRHALVQDAAYELLLKTERQQLHEKVGHALETLFPDRREDLAPVLAHHFEEAGSWASAIEYLTSAGMQALRRFAHREARDLLDRASVHVATHPLDADPRLRVQIGLARAQAGFSFVPFDATLELLEATRELAANLDEPALLALLNLEIGRVRSGRGESYTTSPALRDALDVALRLGDEIGDDRVRAEPLALIGSARLDAGDYSDAIAHFQQALPIMESHQDLKGAALASGHLARAYARIGNFDAARAAATHAMVMAERCGDPNVILDITIFQGIVAADQGALAEAIRLTSEGVRMADDVGNTYCSLVGNFYLGDQHLRIGDAAQALRLLQRSSDLAAFCDASSMLSLSGAWIGAARARLGEDAMDSFAPSLRHAEVIADEYGQGLILQLRASAWARQPVPDWARAAGDLEAAAERFERLGAVPALARSLADLGRAFGAMGEADAAAGATERSEALAREIGLRLDPPSWPPADT